MVKKNSFKSVIIIILLLPIKKKKKTDLYEMYLLQMICLNMLGDHINMLW